MTSVHAVSDSDSPLDEAEATSAVASAFSAVISVVLLGSLCDEHDTNDTIVKYIPDQYVRKARNA